MSHLVVILLAALVAVLSGCSESGDTQPPEMPPPAVTATPVVTEAITTRHEFVGQTRAVDTVDLRARVEGFLERRAFAEGEDVAAGSLLFQIERAPYLAAVDVARADVAEARAELIRATRDLERTQTLFARGNISEQALDRARAAAAQAAAEVDAAEARLRQAELNLGYTEIRAPFAGRIGRSAYSEGSLVGPDSDVLATLVRLDPIRVVFNVSETAYLNYQLRLREAAASGQAVPDLIPHLILPTQTEYPLAGQFDFVDNRVDPTTGTITVRAVFDNPDQLLLPGMFVTVMLETAEPRQALVVPQAAVQEDQAGRFVVVIGDGDRATIRRIETGRQVGINWEVINGLDAGDLVVFEGLQKVRPGQPVAATIRRPTAANHRAAR